ncbi:hypothetical protein KEH51_08310 [[Brevibacterium] frigoritolerans]|uniref:Uncharacterized protein n=1 Tax=Peribacillus frigoritolerans TaxID=450367 RepID=A0A941FN33_9BACI|nr:hypothetical protein [Peribacillus frigoritolerans]
MIGAEVRDSCGSSRTGETPQAYTPRRLKARPAESEHLEGKSTTTHYLVNSNKVCENSLVLKLIQLRMHICRQTRRKLSLWFVQFGR